MDICILNSGFGSRLKRYTEHMPKGMVPLSETETLLSRQINLLNQFGTHRYAITTGYLHEAIPSYLSRHFPALDVTYFYNEAYATTNYIESLNRIGSSFEDEIVLMHGDLVFSYEVSQEVLIQQDNTVIIDSTLPLPEKDFKARVRDGKVVEIGIDVFGADCYACQPLYHLTKDFWNRWQEEIARFCREGNDKVYAENALNLLLETSTLIPLDVSGSLCMEVDNEDDLKTAQEKVENK